jgi:AraC family transcriptional regulator
MDTMVASCDVMKVAHLTHGEEGVREYARDKIEIMIPGEQGSFDAIVIALDRAFFEAKARDALGSAPPAVAGRYDACDPFIREVGNALRTEFRMARVPSSAYLESLAGVIAVHVASNYRGQAQPPRSRTGLAPHKLHKVLAYIEERIAETIGVRQLAAAVHMSPFHFARMFKQAVGHPPHSYITLLRMEHAKNLLSNSDLTLVEIAAGVGYQTQAHFTGVFHKHVGTTPRAFRLRTLAERDAH